VAVAIRAVNQRSSQCCWQTRPANGEEALMKGAAKPKKLQKKVAQKTLKEKRAEKKSKQKSSGF
jgi:hypothetical protein